jgi:lysophospholipase L1-like esterase
LPVRDIAAFLMLCAAAVTTGCGNPNKPTPDPYPDGPQITCPAAPAPATSGTGSPVAVSYTTPAGTGGAPPLTVTCNPPSGSLFSVGSTTVTCTVADARQRTNACTFNVVVVRPPRLQVTRFAAFGDSITWGEDGQASRAFSLASTDDDRFRPRFQLAENYPTVLARLLGARYVTQSPTVANAGLSAEFASALETRRRFSDLVNSGSVDAVLLMEGSNDLSARDDVVSDAAAASLDVMILSAKSRGVKVYLATIPPINPAGFRGQNRYEQLPHYNDRIRQVAAGQNIPLVDIYGALSGGISQYIGFDGLHPTQAGYARIAEVFFEALRSTLEVPGTSTTATSTSPFSLTPLERRWSPPRRR